MAGCQSGSTLGLAAIAAYQVSPAGKVGVFDWPRRPGRRVGRVLQQRRRGRKRQLGEQLLRARGTRRTVTGYLIAWAFERYAPKDSPLYAVRAKAKSVHRGLWQDVRRATVGVAATNQ